MDGRRGSRKRIGRSLERALPLVIAVLATVLASDAAKATIRYGDIQISGNLESQNLVRLHSQFEMQPVQQRNTFRFQYEQALVKNGKLLGRVDVPFIRSVDFFGYYRGVYDSIYDIAPGGYLRTQDGGRGTRISDIRGSERSDIAFEDNIREIYVDVKTKSPLSLRIGRQQIVWGNALTPGVWDTNNTVDAGWHGNQELGLLGRVGFSETRNPFWALKALYDIGSVGPISNAYIEAYDVPFEFIPTNTPQQPAPWGLGIVSPFRPGLVVDAGAADGTGGIPEGLVFVQPCFDFTGNTQPNGQSHTPNSIFANTAKTGFCNSTGLQVSRSIQGIYDRRDPFDVNQFGIRAGGSTPFGLGFSLNYVYRRSSGGDILDSLPIKAQTGAVLGNQTGFLSLDVLRNPLTPTHTTFDPVFKTTSQPLIGFLRIPTEYYYPYIHTVGFSTDYAEDEYTGAVYNWDLAYRLGVPIGTAFPGGSGIKKKDVLSTSLLIDKQLWIRPLNPRSTFTVLFYSVAVVIPDHESLTVDPATGLPTNGDVGIPNTTLIPRATGELNRIDKVRQVEAFSLLAITNFYRGGTILPLLAVLNDWGNMPSQEFIGLLDFYMTNDLVLEGQVRVFTNWGRNVDEPFGLGRFSQYDEIGLKVTYQY